MISANKPELEKAFEEWMNQGPSAPTNGDLVRHDGIDVELLHHLAEFIWDKANNLHHHQKLGDSNG